MQELVAWAQTSLRKPLIFKGARQVGKTFLISEFGAKHFRQCHIFNFEENKSLARIFERDLKPDRILEELAFVTQTPIDRRNDLVFFDEVQECPKALTALKYFSEQMPELALIAAGSLLGIKLSEESFPVGKVDFMTLYPMSFREFLVANQKDLLVETYDKADLKQGLPEMAHTQLWRELLNYYVVGGMPQAITTYLSFKQDRQTAFNEVRKIQKNLIDSFCKDFAKHAGKNNALHIVSVFENIPLQLSAQMDLSTKRYYFNHVIPNKKSFANLQGPIDWLEKAGLIIKIPICNRAEIPLKAFCKNNIFKLFLSDIGLLGAMLHLPIQSILDQDYGITKGYLAENFVAQELRALGNQEFYAWAERNSEIEFLIYRNGHIVPIEVKSGARLQAKSLTQFMLKYEPKEAIKLSANPVARSNQVLNLPLYLAGKLFVSTFPFTPNIQ